MNNLKNMICRFIKNGDGSANNIDISIEEREGQDIIIFIYRNMIQFQIFIPNESAIKGYIIYAIPRCYINSELVFNATMVLNAFNCWATGVNSGIYEDNGAIWFKCARFSHEEIMEYEFESDFRRVLNYCWHNMPTIMDKIQNGIVRSLDFS
mgnify:CR=1 FL=1